MKKVLFVIDERKMGGVSVVLQDILNFINLDKYEIDIMILDNNGDYLNELDKRINIIYGTPFFRAVDYTIKDVIKSKNINLILKKIRLVFLLKTKLIGKRIIKERKKCLTKKYDVEIAFKDGFTAAFTGYGDSLVKYHWLHTDYGISDPVKKYKKLFQEIYFKFDKIIGVSNDVINEFSKYYKAKSLDVVYNLIDSEKIIKGSTLEKVKYSNSKLNIVSVGRMHYQKGYDRLVEVLHKIDLEKKLNDVCFYLIGDGVDYDKIKSLVSLYNLEDKVKLLGKKVNPYPYIAAADLFILPSRYEAYSIVVLETLTLKIPILATKVLSIEETLKDKYGIVVENSEEGLYNGILSVINNKKQLEKYQKNLKNYKYDINAIIKKIEKLLDA